MFVSPVFTSIELREVEPRDEAHLRALLPSLQADCASALSPPADGAGFMQRAIRDQHRIPRLRYDYIIEASTANEPPQAVGLASLVINRGVLTEAEIGYWIWENYRRRGLGKRAAECLRELAFQELAAFRIFARTSRANIPSRRILESLGMRVQDIRSHELVFSLIQPLQLQLPSLDAFDFPSRET